MEAKEIYRDDSPIRRQLRKLTITFEVNGDEYHTDIVVVVAEPIVSVTIEEVPR